MPKNNSSPLADVVPKIWKLMKDLTGCSEKSMEIHLELHEFLAAIIERNVCHVFIYGKENKGYDFRLDWNPQTRELVVKRIGNDGEFKLISRGAVHKPSSLDAAIETADVSAEKNKWPQATFRFA